MKLDKNGIVDVKGMKNHEKWVEAMGGRFQSKYCLVEVLEGVSQDTRKLGEREFEIEVLEELLGVGVGKGQDLYKSSHCQVVRGSPAWCGNHQDS